MIRRNVWLLVLGMVAFGANGCSRPGPEFETSSVDPETQLARALDLYRRGNFRKALSMLQRVSFDLQPGQAEIAQVRYYIAECSFQMGDYIQATLDFRKVADEFASTEYAPLALLRGGDANLRLWRRAELDPSYGETALAIYQELAGRYPESDAAVRARVHVLRLENQFADKTYKNGMFYLKRKAFDSAIIYFKDVIANYPHARRTPDALLRLVDSYRAIGYKQELQETCDHLRRFYPQAAGLDRNCPATADTTATPS